MQACPSQGTQHSHTVLCVHHRPRGPHHVGQGLESKISQEACSMQACPSQGAKNSHRVLRVQVIGQEIHITVAGGDTSGVLEMPCCTTCKSA